MFSIVVILKGVALLHQIFIRQHAAKMGRNPKTGETVSIPRKNSVHFKPGIDLRERVNLAASEHRII